MEYAAETCRTGLTDFCNKQKIGKLWEFLTFRENSSGRTLKALRLNPVKDDDLILMLVVRDGCVRLPFFLDYYRKLGISHFFVVDNGSADRTRELVLEQPDCSLWTTQQRYSTARSGVHWNNYLLRKYCMEKWVLTVDIDEFLVYPKMESRSLRDLVGFLDHTGCTSMFAPMVDCYSAGYLSQAHYNPGDNPLDICPYFDRTGYYRSWSRKGQLFLKGGPRYRAFFSERPQDAPALNKTPLVRWTAGTRYINSTHNMKPLQSRVYDKTGPAPSGALLHFKFFSEFKDQVKNEVDRGEHWKGALQYRQYDRKLQQAEDLNLFCEISEKYKSVSDLELAGLVWRGSWC